MKKPVLVLTPGDPEGIGPEITWKAVQNYFTQGHFRHFHILCVGAQEPFERLGAPLEKLHSTQDLEKAANRYETSSATQPKIWILPAPSQAPGAQFLPGYQAGWSIEQATRLILQGKAAALVTGPISKERLQKGGYLFPGHTEFLAHLCNVPEVTMMLANEHLRVSLVTTHLGIHQVSSALTAERIRRAVLQTCAGLQVLWKIRRPRIALTGLNPHCGESGLFGREEIDLIEPCIQKLQEELSNEAEILGPFSSDTYFARQRHLPQSQRHDAVVCMYHDQGLIPVKLLDFHGTVNVTLGLPIIRTSVDHGVGFDIAGQGIANPSSLQAAIALAASMT